MLGLEPMAPVVEADRVEADRLLFSITFQ